MLTEGQKQSMYNYAKKTLKRIPLDVRKEKYEDIKAAADSAGESVNHYIKKAIDERMQRDNLTAAEPESTLDQDPLPDAEAQHVPNNAGLPEYLTPDVIARIDAKRFLSGDTAYQFEIGSVIGMDHISDLGDYLRQQEKNSKGE